MRKDGVEVIGNAARILTKDRVAPRGAPQTIRAAFREAGLPVVGEQELRQRRKGRKGDFSQTTGPAFCIVGSSKKIFVQIEA